MKYVGDMVS